MFGWGDYRRNGDRGRRRGELIDTCHDGRAWHRGRTMCSLWSLWRREEEATNPQAKGKGDK